MDYIIWGFIAISFVISFFTGKWLKSYWFLFVAPLVGILVSVPSFLVYVRLADVIEKIGLGIIAVLPVLAILISFLNIAASLLGVLAGVIYAKKKSKNN